jgi:hypothetical protein
LKAIPKQVFNPARRLMRFPMIGFVLSAVSEKLNFRQNKKTNFFVRNPLLAGFLLRVGGGGLLHRFAPRNDGGFWVLLLLPEGFRLI